MKEMVEITTFSWVGAGMQPSNFKLAFGNVDVDADHKIPKTTLFYRFYIISSSAIHLSTLNYLFCRPTLSYHFCHNKRPIHTSLSNFV